MRGLTARERHCVLSVDDNEKINDEADALLARGLICVVHRDERYEYFHPTELGLLAARLSAAALKVRV